MQKLNGSQRIFLVYSSFVAISSILVLGGILLSPSESENALWMGLSLPRLIFAFGLLIAFIFFISIAIKASKDEQWAERSLNHWFSGDGFSRGIVWLSGISFGLGWIGCFLPSYRVEIFVNYWSRIRPAIIFILIVSLATLAVFVIRQGKLSIREIRISRAFHLSLGLFLGCLLILGIMLASGFGVHAAEDFWYGAGVPVLASQLIAAIIGGIIFLQVEKKLNWGRSDFIIFLLIYTVTAILWVREPMQGSFTFPGPYPPNHVLYPFADAGHIRFCKSVRYDRAGNPKWSIL